MNRLCLSALSLLLLGAASAPRIPDAVEAGRVAATLTDWQTITYFLMFIIVVMTIERLIAGWQSRSTATKLADAVDRLADATESRASDIKMTLALIQQSQGDSKSTIERVERHLTDVLSRLIQTRPT